MRKDSPDSPPALPKGREQIPSPIDKDAAVKSDRSLPLGRAGGESFFTFLLLFLLAKLAFIALCHGAEPISLSDVGAILWHGLPMDLSTAAYLTLLPWLCAWITALWPAAWRGVRWVLRVYYAVAAVAVVACLVGDIALYPFWGFKLDTTIWTYIDSPKDAVASVSTAFLLTGLAAFLALSALVFWLLNRATDSPPKDSPPALPKGREQIPLSVEKNSAIKSDRSLPLGRAGGESRRAGGESRRGESVGVRSLLLSLGYALVGGLLFLAIRGGVTESTMNVGNAYFSDRQFLNHAAVNPAFSLLASSQKTERFDRLYRAMTDEEAEAMLKEADSPPKDSPPALPKGREQIPLSVEKNSAINSDRSLPLGRAGGESLGGESPFSILLLFWESCGGQLTAHLGSLPPTVEPVTPNLDSIAATGLFFSELRANSFRTDRGTLCTLSGWPSYPTHSLMKMAARAAHLPSLARSLQVAGYRTAFSYGGDINFTNMKGYLLSTGFQHLTADTDFSRADRATAKWGVCDSVFFERLFEDVTATNSPSPFFHAALTLSSHEPWDVPATYRRPGDPDERVAAFRYTDHHLGLFLRRLHETPLWDDLLVVILPDHGVVAADIATWQDPRFFHIPMVWTGGALATLAANAPLPAPPAVIPTLMNQSDLPATLLGLLGLPHDDFPWSRDVLAPSYTHPLAYSTFNDGFVLTVPSDSTAEAPSDSTGGTLTTLVYDNKAQRAVLYGDGDEKGLTRLGKAIQQCSYNALEALR